MKPFNLEEAKAGKPVCTRNGYPVKIITFERNSISFPIVGLIEYGTQDTVSTFTKDGKHLLNTSSGFDLKMVENEPKEPEEITKYCSVLKSPDGTYQYVGVADTPEQARLPFARGFIGTTEVRIKPIKEKQHFEGYINIYRASNKIYLGASVYNTKEQAEAAKPVGSSSKTIKIEWEE